jgi:glycosyltransferase involved in cell wall biosynthesis
VVNLPYHCRLDEFFNIEREPQNTSAPTSSFSGRVPSGRALTLLFCGQMIERKGIDVLLEAAAQAVESGVDLRLLLAGREDTVRERLEGLPQAVRDRIELLGFVAPPDLPGLFARADVMILPSRHDGWGVVINQAMAAGLPVIATSAVQAAAELVVPGNGGWLVAPGDAIALLGAIQDAARLQRSGGLLDIGRFNREQARRLTPEAGARILYQSLVRGPFPAATQEIKPQMNSDERRY